MAQLAEYDFSHFSNRALAAAASGVARGRETYPPEYLRGLMAEAARRIALAPDRSDPWAKYQISIDGGDWDHPTEAVPQWVQDALANPFRTSVCVTHDNGVRYTFRRATDG